MRRFFVFAAASAAVIAIPSSLAVAGLASPAGASGSSVQCAKIKGPALGTLTVSKCTPKSSTNATATFLGSALRTGSGTITWSTSHQTTTVASIVEHEVFPDRCKTGSDEYSATGDVTGGTSTYTKSGDVFSATVCVKLKNLTIKALAGVPIGLVVPA